MLTLASNRLILLTLEKKPVCSILMYYVFLPSKEFGREPPAADLFWFGLHVDLDSCLACFPSVHFRSFAAPPSAVPVLHLSSVLKGMSLV